MERKKLLPIIEEIKYAVEKKLEEGIFCERVDISRKTVMRLFYLPLKKKWQVVINFHQEELFSELKDACVFIDSRKM